ncbi:hypothetical protein [Terrimonas alba]|uniref:hypothetical protein n=1 Tax=Terrimonas alba TaxID=3349636 RepID=UPI0035F467F2
MALNYQRRLENLRGRRFDPDLQKSILSESFLKAQIPEDLKYLAESMQPIENSYNEKTIEAANNVKNHLERGLNLTFSRDYRHQGSVMTKTNIRTHSDIDLLTVIASYWYQQKELAESDKYKGDPKVDIEELRRQAIQILKRIYDEVDDSGSKAITIYNKNLRRKVDIMPCYWYNLEEYEANRDEYWRGVYLYDFNLHQRTKLDYPFAHIRSVDSKGNLTNDGSRRGVRLIKNLKVDSDEKIELSSFQLTSIVHSVENAKLYYVGGSELSIAENISFQLDKMISDPSFRKSVKSPNGTENPLTDDAIVPHCGLLKKDLDQLILDCKSDLRNNYFEKAMKDY